MRVKCLAQEHNTMSPARARTRSARFGVERANHEATAPPTEMPSNIFVDGLIEYVNYTKIISVWDGKTENPVT